MATLLLWWWRFLAGAARKGTASEKAVTLRDTLWLMIDAGSESTPVGVSRRQLGRRAALAAAGTFSATGQDASAASLPAPDQAAVDAKYANVIRKYGERLSPQQRVRARETLIQHQCMLIRIRDFALENSDAPATGFRLYPSDIQPVSGPGRKAPE